MIGKNKAAEANHTQEKITTLIGKEAVFTGDLVVQESVRVDGIINGNCTCKGTLILGEEGQIKGNISAQDIFISGEVKGDIVSNAKLEILSTGRVTGDISARKLVIDEDAHFDGRCTMTNEKSGIVSTEIKKENVG